MRSIRCMTGEQIRETKRRIVWSGASARADGTAPRLSWSMEPTTEEASGVWWRWLPWLILGTLVATWIPSAFDSRLAWIWMATVGTFILASGVLLVAVPTRVLRWRRTYINHRPNWERNFIA